MSFTILWAASTRGFYRTDIHSVLPEDAVEISAEEHAALLDGQAAGNRIVPGEAGRPVLQAPPPPSPERLAANARARRGDLIGKSDGVVTRHRDQVERGGPTTLTPEQYGAWLEYRQALRDVPEQAGFPADIEWPGAPA
jgi:hypothetical protein